MLLIAVSYMRCGMNLQAKLDTVINSLGLSANQVCIVLLTYLHTYWIQHEPVSDSVDCWRVLGDVVAEPAESSLETSPWQTHWQVLEHFPLRSCRGPVTALARRRLPSANRRSASELRPLSTAAPATSFPTISHMTSPTASLASIWSRCWSSVRNVISCGVSRTYHTHISKYRWFICAPKSNRNRCAGQQTCGRAIWWMLMKCSYAERIIKRSDVFTARRYA